jgi:hypothetical protein
VTAPAQSRDDVEAHVPAGLSQLRVELMTDYDGSDVLLVLHEPQLGDRHAPELSDCSSVAYESIEICCGLIEMRIGHPLLDTHLPFATKVRMLDR